MMEYGRKKIHVTKLLFLLPISISIMPELKTHFGKYIMTSKDIKKERPGKIDEFRSYVILFTALEFCLKST